MTGTHHHDTEAGTEPTVLTERRGNVAVITLNRPAARNAVNVQLAQQLVDAMAAAQDAKCIVLTGTGKAFCAGLDLRNLGTDKLMDLPPFIASVTASTIPVIAAVNGAAVTGGFELALACDFIVASSAAAFADTHLRVGVYPGPVLVELPRRVGMAMAREMSLTGNFVDAQTALHIGLANHVVPPEVLMEFTLTLAEAIAEQPADMVACMRRDWDETGALPVQQAHRRHMEIARDGGFHGVGQETLNDNMNAVVARAKRQGV